MELREQEKPVKTLAEVMNVAPLAVDESVSVLAALEMMRARRVSAALVGPAEQPKGASSPSAIWWIGCTAGLT